MNWADRAACRGKPLHLWFPPSGGAMKTARIICAGCPVRQPCLTEALEQEAGEHVTMRSGMRGGLTPAERAGRDRTGAVR